MPQYNKRILLSVTGMSPAVVTETLYALVTEKNFIPTEIQVITTIQGKNKLLSALLGIEGGRKERKGALQEFIEDYGEQYGFSKIHFDESCIHIIEDKNGEKLPDIRTPQENEFAADNIVKLVGELCQDDETQLHVSIAGGRKTMGFFMGYALSLYGRKQDSLSHVLVDEQFETLPNFYYRKPYPHIIINRDGVELDASKANIMLAEIPWVRLGLGVPDELKAQKISYSQSVQNAQQIWETPSLTFLDPIDDRIIRCGNKEIKFSPREYALLLALAVCRKRGERFSLEYRKDLDRAIALYAKIIAPLTEKFGGTEQEIIEKFHSTGAFFSEACRDARTGIVKKIRKEFSIGKETKSAYFPYSQDFCYYLDIERIDYSAVWS